MDLGYNKTHLLDNKAHHREDNVLLVGPQT